MCKKLLSLTLAALLIHLLVGAQSASASTDTQKQARLAEKIKVGILKLGIGKEARVAVKLRDKTKLVGYVSEVREDRFAITDISTGATTMVTYPDVAQVKGHNLSTGAKIAIIGLAIAAGVLAFFLWLENYG
jgi:hypothetical protein